MTLNFLSGVANDVEFDNYAIIASLKSEPIGKLINILPGLMFARLRFENACRIPRQAFSKPFKFDIKRHSPSILYL